MCVEQEELAMLRRHLEGRDGELRRLHDETGFRGITPVGMDIGDRGDIMGRS